MNRILTATFTTAAAVALVLGCAGAQAKGNAEAGKAKAETCKACHGEGGNKPTGPDFPVLAGQYPDYIKKALSDYKSGKRSNPIMKGFAATLSSQEMDDLAAWFASQPSDLITHR